LRAAATPPVLLHRSLVEWNGVLLNLRRREYRIESDIESGVASTLGQASNNETAVDRTVRSSFTPKISDLPDALGDSVHAETFSPLRSLAKAGFSRTSLSCCGNPSLTSSLERIFCRLAGRLNPGFPRRGARFSGVNTHLRVDAAIQSAKSKST
jgi:hypothetical protein